MVRPKGKLEADWLVKTQGAGRANETDAGQVWEELRLGTPE